MGTQISEKLPPAIDFPQPRQRAFHFQPVVPDESPQTRIHRSQATPSRLSSETIAIIPRTDFTSPAHQHVPIFCHRVLSTQEFRRRLWHMTPGLLPLLLWVIPHTDPWGWILWSVVLGLTLMTATVMLRRFSKIARPGEDHGYDAVLAYAVVVLATLWLFPGREEIGMMTLAILAFGDGSATLLGLKFGERKLPWNGCKSWVGLWAFVAMGTLAGALMFWGEFRPGVDFRLALGVSFLASLTAGLVESFPSLRNDNLRVGIAAAGTGAIAHFLLIPS